MRYKLLAAHYTKESIYLEPGTIVGDGTRYPWPDPPTSDMQPLDTAAQNAFDAIWKRDPKTQRWVRFT